MDNLCPDREGQTEELYLSLPEPSSLFINAGGALMDLKRPKIMGILNATPDSFYSRSRTPEGVALRSRVSELREEGADIVDVGACSTRPGAAPVDEAEEWRRLEIVLKELHSEWPEAVVSVDTYRASVARRAVEEFGAAIINDVSGGTMDPEMFGTVAELKVAYVLMHMRGTPATMQSQTDYGDVGGEVLSDLAFKCAELRKLGVCDIILDPGFGFAKTTEQNYRLFSELPAFRQTGLPLLVGISRKSMIWRPLEITPEESLAGTTALNMAALMGGASILRVHDVAAARQTVDVFGMLCANARPADERNSIMRTTKNQSANV